VAELDREDPLYLGDEFQLPDGRIVVVVDMIERFPSGWTQCVSVIDAWTRPPGAEEECEARAARGIRGRSEVLIAGAQGMSSRRPRLIRV
jgi:hypothetical protein